jgi:hypothetical protein
MSSKSLPKLKTAITVEDMIDEPAQHLTEVQDRLTKAIAYTQEILRRAERTNDRLFAYPREASDDSDAGDPIYMGAIETIGYQITYLMDALQALDGEVRTTGGL